MNESNTTDRKTRSFEMTVEVQRPVEVVWKALTDAEELVRWFPMQARVEPGEGGTLWLGWDEQWFFDTAIELWEPGRRLRLIERRQDGAPVVMDFTLEGRGGTTVLRLVHSGFGFGGDWDGEFDGISRGWSYELRCLPHYLERHHGSPRNLGWVKQPTTLSPDEAWARVMGPDGLVAAGSVAGLDVGDAYTMRTAAGETLDGRVLTHHPGRCFAGMVPGLGDAVWRYEFEGSTAVLNLSLWGDRKDEAEAFETRWKERLAKLL